MDEGEAAMSTQDVLSRQGLTYMDWAMRTDPDGAVPAIVEILKQTNPILDDAVVVEGNLPTGHRTTVRSGLPQVAWRMLNYGVPPTKSRTVQVDDTCGMLEAYAEVDKDLADLNGNSREFRLSEDQAFLEAMNQEMCRTLFYGDMRKTPDRFMGLAPRYNDPEAENADNIIDAGGRDNQNASVWLVTWDDQTCHMTFPKGKKAGLQHTDLGEITLEDQAGGRFQGYRSHYKWDAGLVLRDWRYVVRIANIDVPALASFGSTSDTSAHLIRSMIEAANRLPSLSIGRPVFYVNQAVKTWLDIMASEKSNVQLSMDSVAGRPVTSFLGIPVRRCDALASSEAALV
jgi:hypothetical protein